MQQPLGQNRGDHTAKKAYFRGVRVAHLADSEKQGHLIKTGIRELPVTETATLMEVTCPATPYDVTIRVLHGNDNVLRAAALDPDDRRSGGDWGRVDSPGVCSLREVDQRR